MKTIIIGLVVHILILWAGFDIYFKSPLIHGMKQFRTTDTPPAKRLVLIVSDGLRADAIFRDRSDYLTPFLNTVMSKRGSWGVSHTTVPTESRPGHVALFAGIYEDPSAIAKGWKENPVDFDSIVNQSTNTYGWGSPDIMNIFNKSGQPRVHLRSYTSEMEDFAKKSTDLDEWVLNEVLRKLKYEAINKNLSKCEEFCANGNLFFLHLLGMDTVGHANKPNSLEYVENIKYVDTVVEQFEKAFDAFFQDNGTAYVFTSDHGMTDWGSHGSGTPHETEVPFIAWGAGFKKNPKRNDVKQADVTPLLAAVVGWNIPVNSVGQVPHSYLDVHEGILAKIMLANVNQLAELYITLERQMRQSLIKSIYVPYAPLGKSKLQIRLKNLESLVNKGNYKTVIHQSKLLMKDLINGREYFLTYFQCPVIVAISIAFTLWMFYLAVTIANLDRERQALGSPKYLSMGKYPTHLCKYIFVPIFATMMFLIYVQSLPLMYYVYFSAPFAMFWLLLSEIQQCTYTMMLLKNMGWLNVCKHAAVYGGALIIMIAGFFHRTYFVILLGDMILWCILRDQISMSKKIEWSVTCVFMAVFLMLPVMKTSFSLLIYLAGVVVWIVLISWLAWRPYFMREWLYYIGPQSKINIITQHVFCAISVVIAVFTRTEIGMSHPVVVNIFKAVSWILLGQVFITPLFSGFLIFNRLFSIVLSMLTFYLLVSVNYEVLFLACYTLMLHQWLFMEGQLLQRNFTFRDWFFDINSDQNVIRYNSKEDIRQAFFFLTFILLGFFGTGNIASISSFDPMWVKPFVTVFSPFTMTALILLKLSIPFLLASCALRTLNVMTRNKVIGMYSVILLICDFMVLVFLYQIKNTGSWLEIGTSLSHFIIADVTVIILILLYMVAYCLTSYVIKCFSVLVVLVNLAVLIVFITIIIN